MEDIDAGKVRIMENQMETPIVYRGYIGIMEKKMEATIVQNMSAFNYSSDWGCGNYSE